MHVHNLNPTDQHMQCAGDACMCAHNQHKMRKEKHSYLIPKLKRNEEKGREIEENASVELYERGNGNSCGTCFHHLTGGQNRTISAFPFSARPFAKYTLK